jgi:hypothetical protein
MGSGYCDRLFPEVPSFVRYGAQWLGTIDKEGENEEDSASQFFDQSKNSRLPSIPEARPKIWS